MITEVNSFNNDGHVMWKSVQLATTHRREKFDLLERTVPGGLQMRRRGNNNCSSACTPEGHKASPYKSTNRENERREGKEREREKKRRKKK